MGRRVRVWVVLAFVGALFLFVGQTGPPGSPWPGGGQIAPQTAAKEARQPREANPLDGCRHLWLDVGMNIGVQTRKVYEPGLYPDAPALPHLAKFFDGLPKSDICSFGFEPNPDHKRRLDTLEARYRAVGIRIKVFRGAASDKDGETSFYLDRDDPGREWGARIDPMSFQKDKVTVPSIDFASWFARFALTRQIPPSSDPLRDTKPVIAMKLDIEGHDAHVLNPMLRLGLLCKIDLLLLEGVHLQHVQMTWLPGQFKEAIKGCPTRVEGALYGGAVMV